MREFIRRILGSEKLAVKVACSQQEAVKRLKVNIETNMRKATTGRPSFGRVSSVRVTFAMYRPSLPSAFRWYFDGTIKPVEGVLLLEGELALSRFSKWFFGVWLVFTVLVGALSAAEALAGGFSSASLGMTGTGIHAQAFFVMLAFGGAALIVPGLLRVPKDVAEMRAVIERSFKGATA